MINAFGGECMAHMRYRIFARQADKDGYPNVARLFLAIADAEYIHAGDHYKELRHLDDGRVAGSMGAFGPGDTPKNLGLAVAGESYEIEEMYPSFMAIAEPAGREGRLPQLPVVVRDGEDAQGALRKGEASGRWRPGRRAGSRAGL